MTKRDEHHMYARPDGSASFEAFVEKAIKLTTDDESRTCLVHSHEYRPMTPVSCNSRCVRIRAGKIEVDESKTITQMDVARAIEAPVQ